MIVVDRAARVFEIAIDVLDRLVSCLDDLRSNPLKARLVAEERERERPGHQADRDLLPGNPVNSQPVGVLGVEATDLLAKRFRHSLAKRRLEDRRARHSIGLWKARRFPAELDVAHPRLVSEDLRPVQSRTPAAPIERIGVPVHRPPVVRRPSAETEDATVLGVLRGLDQLFELRSRDPASHGRSNRAGVNSKRTIRRPELCGEAVREIIWKWSRRSLEPSNQAGATLELPAGSKQRPRKPQVLRLLE